MSGAATTAALVRAATRHKLTSAEWTVFCLLATEPNFRVRWQPLLRLIAGNHSNEYRRQVGLTDAGLRKGLLALETRGWVQVERGNRWGQHPEVYLVELLPVIVQQWPVDDDGAVVNARSVGDRPRNSQPVKAGPPAATKPPARGPKTRKDETWLELDLGRFTLIDRGPGRYEVQFEETARGRHGSPVILGGISRVGKRHPLWFAIHLGETLRGGTKTRKRAALRLHEEWAAVRP